MGSKPDYYDHDILLILKGHVSSVGRAIEHIQTATDAHTKHEVRDFAVRHIVKTNVVSRNVVPSIYTRINGETLTNTEVHCRVHLLLRTFDTFDLLYILSFLSDVDCYVSQESIEQLPS